MDYVIKNIEYIVPIPDKPVGSLRFEVEIPIAYKDGSKMPSEGEDQEVTLSLETQRLLSELGKSVIKDLEK